MLPYSPAMLSGYAEKILSYIPKRTEDGLHLVSDTATNEQVRTYVGYSISRK